MKFKVGDVVVIKDKKHFLADRDAFRADDDSCYRIPFGTNIHKLEYCDGTTPHVIMSIIYDRLNCCDRIKLEGVRAALTGSYWSWSHDSLEPYVAEKNVTKEVHKILLGEYCG